MSKTPTLTIGLPVYNGQNYLEQAVRALLAQTYTDFELVISDNASTDQTSAMCAAFAAEDPRVRHVRHEENQGLIWNFNRAFELARGTYFKWSAHDDLLGPDFLRLCVEALEADPSLAVCCTTVAVIDAEGYELQPGVNEGDTVRDPLGVTRLRDRSGDERGLESESIARRHRGVLLESTRCYEEFGVIRADAIRATPLREYYPGSEKVFLTELALQGKVKVLPEVAMFMRVHDDRLSSQAGSADRRALYLPPSGRRRRTLVPPQVRCAWGYWRAVWRQPMPLRDRLGCVANITRFMCQVRKWGAVLGIALLGNEPVVSANAPTRGRKIQLASPPNNPEPAAAPDAAEPPSHRTTQTPVPATPA